MASCVYIKRIKETETIGCVLIQLLNLYCLRQDEYLFKDKTTLDPSCLSEANTGLAVDAVCFVFAMIQYRIFKSIYFKYVIREHRKQSDMATRLDDLWFCSLLFLQTCNLNSKKYFISCTCIAILEFILTYTFVFTALT